MQKYDPKWARDYLEATEKAFDNLPLYSAEWPPGYQEAYENYPGFESDSAQESWDGLDNWRRYEGQSLHLRAAFKPDEEYRESERETVAEFHAQILKAVYEGNSGYLKKLIKAIESQKRPPGSELNGIRAAIKAFEELFVGRHLHSRDEWPTKQEVRRRAEQILKGAGRPLPVERHWPRIFKKAGLSELLSVTYGPVRRAKK